MRRAILRGTGGGHEGNRGEGGGAKKKKAWGGGACKHAGHENPVGGGEKKSTNVFSLQRLPDRGVGPQK